MRHRFSEAKVSLWMCENGRPSCVCFRHTWRTPRRLLWFGGGGEDSHLRTVGLSVLNWGLCANPTSLAERHAAAGGVRRPWGTAADPILRCRMGLTAARLLLKMWHVGGSPV